MRVDIQALIQQLVERQLFTQAMHQEQDPAKFPRSAQVVDDRALLLLAERDLKIQAAHRLLQEIALLHAETEALSQRIFKRLREAYPGVEPRPDAPSGFRRWQGDWHFVSWDDQPQHLKPEH